MIEGVPLEVGSREVTIRLDDADATSPAVERRVVLELTRAGSSLELTAPPVVEAGAAVPVTVKVVPQGQGAPSGTIHVEVDGEHCSLAAPARTCVLVFEEAGRRTIKATLRG